MKRPTNITGQRFGQLTAKHRVPGPRRMSHWLCACDCGGVSTVRIDHLRAGKTASCGCGQAPTKHGAAPRGAWTPEYKSFVGAKQRCTNAKRESFKHYGGRGIRFLFVSFEQFLLEVGPRPKAGMSLDRIDVNGNYEPGNVRWATQSQQVQNRRPRAGKKVA